MAPQTGLRQVSSASDDAPASAGARASRVRFGAFLRSQKGLMASALSAENVKPAGLLAYQKKTREKSAEHLTIPSHDGIIPVAGLAMASAPRSGLQGLTRKQRRVLDTLVDFWEHEDRPPTTRELADELGCHVKTIYQYVITLEARGAIERRKGRIHVAPELRSDRGVPIVGRVAAGTPILAVENREGVLSLTELFGREDVFAVQVVGNSMKDAGILDGDQVIVQVTPEPRVGAICVCYLGEDQEVTVKRLKKRGGGFELLPANDAYRPIRVARGDRHFRIGGKVIGVVRRII